MRGIAVTASYSLAAASALWLRKWVGPLFRPIRPGVSEPSQILGKTSARSSVQSSLQMLVKHICKLCSYPSDNNAFTSDGLRNCLVTIKCFTTDSVMHIICHKIFNHKHSVWAASAFHLCICNHMIAVSMQSVTKSVTGLSNLCRDTEMAAETV